MKKSRFTNEQIAFALRSAEAGKPVEEVYRTLGIRQQTCYRWKKNLTGMGVDELRRMQDLDEENKRLEVLVADLSLDKQILQDVLSKKPSSLLVSVRTCSVFKRLKPVRARVSCLARFRCRWLADFRLFGAEPG